MTSLTDQWACTRVKLTHRRVVISCFISIRFSAILTIVVSFFSLAIVTVSHCYCCYHLAVFCTCFSFLGNSRVASWLVFDKRFMIAPKSALYVYACSPRAWWNENSPTERMRETKKWIFLTQTLYYVVSLLLTSSHFARRSLSSLFLDC